MDVYYEWEIIDGLREYCPGHRKGEKKNTQKEVGKRDEAEEYNTWWRSKLANMAKRD